jgi:hypothetical protein
VESPGWQRAPDRKLLSYLVVPRPKDLVKAVVVPVTFALGAAAGGGVTASQVWRAALVWLVLELLAYQARYQWNDVRGFAADQAHPDRAARGRLPGPPDRARLHIGASLAIAAFRVLLAAAVAVLVPEVRTVIFATLLGVFGVGFVYEFVRSLATGGTAVMPVPLRPSLIGLWVAVGAGYALRGMTGLALSVDLGSHPALVAMAILAMWAFGVVFVTCRWAIEASCFASFRGDCVVWDVRVASAREHTLGLVRWLPHRVDRRLDPFPARWRALQGRTPLSAPWNLALVVASPAAAVAGRLLVSALDWRTGIAIAVAAAVVAAVMPLLPRGRAAASLAAAAALAGAESLSGLDRPLVATLPWLVVLLGYSCFTHQCASEIGRPLRRLESLLRR